MRQAFNDQKQYRICVINCLRLQKCTLGAQKWSSNQQNYILITEMLLFSKTCKFPKTQDNPHNFARKERVPEERKVIFLDWYLEHTFFLFFVKKTSFFTNAKNTLSLAAKTRPSRRGHKSRYQYDFFFCFFLSAGGDTRYGHSRRLATPLHPRIRRIVRGQETLTPSNNMTEYNII